MYQFYLIEQVQRSFFESLHLFLHLLSTLFSSFSLQWAFTLAHSKYSIWSVYSEQTYSLMFRCCFCHAVECLKVSLYLDGSVKFLDNSFRMQLLRLQMLERPCNKEAPIAQAWIKGQFTLDLGRNIFFIEICFHPVIKIVKTINSKVARQFLVSLKRCGCDSFFRRTFHTPSFCLELN